VLVDNKTPFTFESVFLSDEQGCPLYVPLVQATYQIGQNGSLAVAEKQPPVKVAGEYWGDPESTSLKYEPVFAFMKPATDVVLIGHAHAPSTGTRRMEVGIRVGPVGKVVTVIGDRLLVRRLAQTRVTDPKPFDRIPLIYERAFGGWDTRSPDEKKPRFESRNPVGTGFRSGSIFSDEELKLPNLEDGEHLYRSYGDTPPPAGFGFIAPHWKPRAALGGTYDSAWEKERKPLLPRDFDRRFFNSGSAGLIAPGHLRGDEPVIVVGASPEGRMAFQLPGVPAPICHVARRIGGRVSLQTTLDTVVVNMDERLLILTWRAYTPIRSGAHDVAAVSVGGDVRASAMVLT
jgi:hypothetical protein